LKEEESERGFQGDWGVKIECGLERGVGEI
jgi:hypothetical protein